MRFFDQILNLFFPPKCVSCDCYLPHQETVALCPLCRSRYETEKRYHCPECHKEHTDCECVPKILQKRVKTAMHLVEYIKEESAARDMILCAKDEYYEYLYRFLSAEITGLLEKRLSDPSEYLYTFVPRSVRKVAERGVDQAREVAKRVAKAVGGDFAELFTHLHTKEQKQLSAAERKRNVQKSYFLKESQKESLSGKRVIVYDDVITTGATLSAVISQLQKAKVKEVIVVTFGKTYLETQTQKTPIL